MSLASEMPARFWKRIKLIPSKRFPGEPCWVWQGALSKRILTPAGRVRTTGGYGVAGVGPKKTMRVHIWAYTALVEPVPEGLELDHLCRVRACVNPGHMTPRTCRENLMARGSRSVAKLNAEKTHCLRGHEFTPENTRLCKGPSGVKRRCRECARLHKEAWQRKRA